MFSTYLLRLLVCLFFFFNDTPTTEIYTLSLHDALPISLQARRKRSWHEQGRRSPVWIADGQFGCARRRTDHQRSEEHTSELQSHVNLVCRLLLEKKKKK